MGCAGGDWKRNRLGEEGHEGSDHLLCEGGPHLCAQTLEGGHKET